MPETVFFKGNQIDFVTMNDVNGSLAFDLKVNRTEMPQVRARLQDAVRLRRRDFQKFGKEILNHGLEERLFEKTSTQTQSGGYEANKKHQPLAIVRYRAQDEFSRSVELPSCVRG